MGLFAASWDVPGDGTEGQTTGLIRDDDWRAVGLFSRPVQDAFQQVLTHATYQSVFFRAFDRFLGTISANRGLDIDYVTVGRIKVALFDFIRGHDITDALVTLDDPNVVHKMAELSIQNVPNTLWLINATDGQTGGITQGAFLYALICTQRKGKAIRKVYMQGKNSWGITNFVATKTDEEYIQYMLTEHPSLAATVRKLENGKWHSILPVMGYLIEG